MSFLRFVAFERLGQHVQTSGPFNLAYSLAKDAALPIYYRQPLRRHLDWFDTNLPVPKRFQKRLGRTSRGVGVCWFRESATLHIARMRELCRILDEIGYVMSPRWSALPGDMLYQDEFQIVAIERKCQAHEC